MIRFGELGNIDFVYFKGGGGGGSSGRVDFPEYMKDWHGIALDDGGVDVLNTSITDVMNASLGSSPFIGAVAYDPDTPVAAMIGAPDDLGTLVDLLSAGTGLNTLINNVLDEGRIDDAVTEFSEDLGNRLTVEVLPRFEAGMRDINGVLSSAFVIGRAVIEDGQTRQVAKYSADLHLKAFSDDAIKIIQMKLDFQRVVSSLIIEANRLKIVAKKEEADGNLKIDESDALWDLEVFKYGGNLLASISGATISTQKHQGSSTAQSVIGGGLSGAAAGALIGMETGWWGGPAGAIGGAILGAGMGLLG